MCLLLLIFVKRRYVYLILCSSLALNLCIGKYAFGIVNAATGKKHEPPLSVTDACEGVV